MVLLSTFATAYSRYRCAPLGMNPSADSVSTPALLAVGARINADQGFNGGIGAGFGSTEGIWGQSHASGGLPHR